MSLGGQIEVDPLQVGAPEVEIGIDAGLQPPQPFADRPPLAGIAAGAGSEPCVGAGQGLELVLQALAQGVEQQLAQVAGLAQVRHALALPLGPEVRQLLQGVTRESTGLQVDGKGPAPQALSSGGQLALAQGPEAAVEAVAPLAVAALKHQVLQL